MSPARARWTAILGCLGALLTALPAAAQLHVIGVGDSLTAGNDWLGPMKNSLEPEWTSEDHGLAGKHSWQAADGIHCSPSPEDCQTSQSTGRFRDLLAGRTRSLEDVIVLLWGTNDVRHICWSEANPTGPDDCRGFTRASLEQMTDDALAAGYPVVIGIPPPVVDAPNSNHTPEEIATFGIHLDLLKQMVFDIAAERNHPRLAVGDAYTWYQALPGWVDSDYYRLSNGFSDGVHPGTEPGPSGSSGRLHLAEPLVAAVGLAAAPLVPAADGWGLALIGLALAVLARKLLARSRG